MATHARQEPWGRKVLDFVKQPIGWLSVVALVLVVMCCYTGAVMGGLLPGWSQERPPTTEAVAPLPSAPEPVATTVAPLLPEPSAEPEPEPEPSQSLNPRCHPNYSVCLPIVRKLSCNQIRQRDFDVVGGRDPYGLDPDRDGKACERRRGD